MPFGGTIEDSVSMSGMPYGMLPNAGKFEQAFDQSCSCRRKDQSWAEALAAIEARLQRHPGDILVTPEISERMSRPAAAAPISVAKARAADADALALVAKPESEPVVLDANGVDTNLHAATAAVSRETSGIGVEETGGAHYGLNQGEVVEQQGSDGSVNARADRCADISLATRVAGSGRLRLSLRDQSISLFSRRQAERRSGPGRLVERHVDGRAIAARWGQMKVRLSVPLFTPERLA